MRDAFAGRLVELARTDPSIELLTGDLGFGVLDGFRREFPERFHNVGIAEQLLIEMAVGMSMAGKKVVCYSIGNFPILRCFEQIRNDAAYGLRNVKIVEVGGGYTYGSLGMSHWAVEDLAGLLSLPNVAIFAPSDRHEALLATDLLFSTEGTCVLRLERPSPETVHDGSVCFETNSGLLQSVHGEDTAIVSFGGIACQMKQVAMNMGFSLFTCPVIKPIDAELIARQLSGYRRIAIVEEHASINGVGSYLLSILMNKNLNAEFLLFGTPDRYPDFVGDQEHIRKWAGLSPRDIELKLK